MEMIVIDDCDFDTSHLSADLWSNYRFDSNGSSIKFLAKLQKWTLECSYQGEYVIWDIDTEINLVSLYFSREKLETIFFLQHE